MIIKAIKFRKDGSYTQPFVMGGEEGADKFDKISGTAATFKTI